MKRFLQTLKVVLAVFLTVFSSGLVQLWTAPEVKAAPKEQVTICHYLGNNTWNSLTAAPEIVFNSGHDTHQDKKDIIPAFEYVKQGETLSFPGLNYDAAGKAILANDCSAATVSVGELACVAEGATQNVDIVINNLKVVANIYVYHKGGTGPDYAGMLQPSTSQTLSVKNLAVGSYSVDIVSGQTIIASTSFTIEACDTTPTTPTYYLQTSHNASVCGQVTISLRNVSPWLYRVLIEQEVSPGVWERVGASTGDLKWQAASGVMVVDNRGDAPDDQTGTYIVKFAEDSNGGTRNIRYKVTSGTERDLYLGLPVGQNTIVSVNTDCQPPADMCLNIDGLQTTVPTNLVRGEDGNCYKRVFVCKFVGTPGVDERLQNIISVSVNSIGNNQWDGSVPGWFSDAQDRSFVLGYDDGTWDPTEEDCLPAPSEAGYVQTPCVVGTNTTDSVSITVKNTADSLKEDVVYVISLTPQVGAATTKTVTVADGEELTIIFANLPAGQYQLSVSASDGTIFEPETVTVGQCTVAPGQGGGQILGEAAHTTTPNVLPTTLPATGASDKSNPLLVIVAAVTAYGATYFFQNRRKLAADEA